jgi:hypothetical protein
LKRNNENKMPNFNKMPKREPADPGQEIKGKYVKPKIGLESVVGKISGGKLYEDPRSREDQIYDAQIQRPPVERIATVEEKLGKKYVSPNPDDLEFVKDEKGNHIAWVDRATGKTVA